MRRLLPVMWAGFAINAVSGVLLLVAYPAKALTNPVFYLKLAAIGAAIALTGSISRRVFVLADAGTPLEPAPAVKRAAGITIVLWLIATITGRLLAYTYSVLMATEPNFY
jgi:hypothetical protein